MLYTELSIILDFLDLAHGFGYCRVTPISPKIFLRRRNIIELSTRSSSRLFIERKQTHKKRVVHSPSNMVSRREQPAAFRRTRREALKRNLAVARSACPLSPRETALRGSQDEHEWEARVNPDLPSLGSRRKREEFYLASGPNLFGHMVK